MRIGLNSVVSDTYHFDDFGRKVFDSPLYYFGEDGNKVVNATINIGGVQYIIDEDGDVTISEEQSDQVDSRLIEMFKEGMKYLGTYYSSDVNQGIDCSQFITYMLQMADIDLTDLAFIQYYEFRNNLDYEIYYDIESLQPGDLIFYYSMDCEYGDNCEFWNEIHHVAMYMGD